jgi:hypothetical protein
MSTPADAIADAPLPPAADAAPSPATTPASHAARPEPLDPRAASGVSLAPHRPWWVESLGLVLAFAVSAAFLWFVLQHWAPAHAGNNQNGYLASGRLLAQTGSPGFEPASPFEFVGWMWGMADPASTAPGGGMHYAKYPLGYSLLVSLAWLVAPADRVVEWVHLVNPIAMALAVLGVYFIARQLMHPLAAVVASLLTASNPVLLVLANNPNSHATAVCFVTWGIACLVRAVQRPAPLAAVAGGLLLGYACTIRYTEGLLVLPLLLVCLLSIRRGWKPALRAFLPLLAWSIPVLAQVAFNWFAIGQLTGYDSTNESTGFAFDHFKEKWQFAIRELYATGAYFLLPIGLLGLLTMVQWRWRTAAVLILWLVPGALLYMAYYWGRGLGVWGFLRFYATLLPAIVIAAAWVIERTVVSLPGRKLVAVVGAAIFAAFVTYLNTDSTRGALQRDHTVAANIAFSAAKVREHVPPRAVLFGESQRMLNHLQSIGDWQLVGGDWVLGQFPLPRIRTRGEEDANPIQPARRAFLERAINPLSPADRARHVQELVARARAQGRDAFILLTPGRATQLAQRMFSRHPTTEVARWTEPNTLGEEAMRNMAGIGSTGTTDPAPRTYVLLRLGPPDASAAATTAPTTLPAESE